MIMDKEILDILKAIQTDISGMKDDISELKEGQPRLEQKVDGIAEQTAELLEFKTAATATLDKLIAVTKQNCFDITYIKATHSDADHKIQ